MKIQSKSFVLILFFFTTPIYATTSMVPFGNGAWVYDSTYDSNGSKGPRHAGLHVQQLEKYNQHATSGNEINQIFTYGGSIEMYCRGSSGSDPSTPCGPNQFMFYFYPPKTVSDSKNNWDYYMEGSGDSGYSSFESYKVVKKTNNNVIVIDGRVDGEKSGGYDYLDHLNTLSQKDAAHFADKIAKLVCASNAISGVQFDIEPFSFTGKSGSYSGQGQQYFYTEIAKDFSGYYGNSQDPSGINHDLSSDPLHCVDQVHPHGRFFSVFTSSKKVTPIVATTFTHHGNGLIIDSLYDLGSKSGGNVNTPEQFKSLITAEINNMKKIADQNELSYQFAIPASASVHEFETKDGIGTGYQQLTYVKEAINSIQPRKLKVSDHNFKGVDLWTWHQAMWWHKMKFTPASPTQDVLYYLEFNL